MSFNSPLLALAASKKSTCNTFALFYEHFIGNKTYFFGRANKHALRDVKQNSILADYQRRSFFYLLDLATKHKIKHANCHVVNKANIQVNN